MIGRTLSHYRIQEEISRGGMGIVYRALDTSLDREVAVKVLPPELMADQSRRRRFVQGKLGGHASDDVAHVSQSILQVVIFELGE